MLRNQAPKARTRAVTRARSLRRQMTLPEVLLWQVLRARPFGLKFRRQSAAGPYVLDFYCSDARLAIEVDGEAHSGPAPAARDARRDAFFAAKGIHTLRVPARDVLHDVGTTVDAIVAACRVRLPLHHPASPGGPPPRDELGED
ncbi:endonuclease domain-containing protein [Stakelama saccharophila]|uniref:DUF559 domain-containing protein n=1 Tax=Stakelama saccharophila TaxID=3075605 RepID=A0ABZ0B8J0_9SPHN|nr:DUF559 domain-containing protein [Stakelama sp. W311]WNO52916.1 DUF559 domain-containing protein [Stakelama sp. W311]